MKREIGKKIGIVTICLVTLLALSSGANSVWATSYDGTNPYTTGCATNSSIIYSAPIKYKGSTIGTNYLHYSWSCHTAWAYAKLSSPAPYKNYVNAGVRRKNGGYTEYCAHTPYGNGTIDKEQTSCFSPQIYDKDPEARAEAIVYDGSTTGATSYY